MSGWGEVVKGGCEDQRVKNRNMGLGEGKDQKWQPGIHEVRRPALP